MPECDDSFTIAGFVNWQGMLSRIVPVLKRVDGDIILDFGASGFRSQKMLRADLFWGIVMDGFSRSSCDGVFIW